MKILFLILVYNSICKLHNFDGKDFDLDPLIKTGTNRYSGRYKGDDVYWNILSNVYVGDVEGCEDKEQVAVTASEGLCYGRASLENQTSSLINSTGGLLLNYTSSEMFLASFAIKIVCSEEESTPSITSTKEHFVVTMETKYGCPVTKPDPNKPDPNKPDPKKDPKSKKLSFGSIMLIILSVLLVLYFAAGIPIMKFGLKKEGIEIIPFVRFWLAVPGLVIDGVKFILSPCLKSKSGYKNVDKGEAI